MKNIAVFISGFFIVIGFVGSSCTPKLSSAKLIHQPDIEAPVFVSFPENIVDTCGNISDFGTPVAEDNSGKTHLIFLDQKEGSCEEGMKITRIWSARDSAGNSIQRNQIIQLVANKNIGQLVLDDKLYIDYEENRNELKLRFLLSELKNVKASVSDMNGETHFKIEKELQAGQQSVSVDVTNFPSGTYFVMLNYDNKWLSRQFVR